MYGWPLAMDAAVEPRGYDRAGLWLGCVAVVVVVGKTWTAGEIQRRGKRTFRGVSCRASSRGRTSYVSYSNSLWSLRVDDGLGLDVTIGSC